MTSFVPFTYTHTPFLLPFLSTAFHFLNHPASRSLTSSRSRVTVTVTVTVKITVTVTVTLAQYVYSLNDCMSDQTHSRYLRTLSSSYAAAYFHVSGYRLLLPSPRPLLRASCLIARMMVSPHSSSGTGAESLYPAPPQRTISPCIISRARSLLFVSVCVCLCCTFCDLVMCLYLCFLFAGFYHLLFSFSMSL
jgi:hypothetical protein